MKLRDCAFSPGAVYLFPCAGSLFLCRVPAVWEVDVCGALCCPVVGAPCDSAVDAHVGAHIFNEMLCKELDGKTRVLVTNQVCPPPPHTHTHMCY